MDILNDVRWPEGVKEAIEKDDVETVKKLMKNADDFLSQFSAKLITAEEFRVDLNKRNDILVFDLRDKKSFNESPIKNSINIPYGIGLSEKVKVADNKKIILTCFAGKISKVAGHLLNEEGYDNIYVLEGGMMAYTK